jgi:anti-sigma factor RsiW
MRSATEMELMRLLHGELPPERERELRARLAREPELAAAFARLERTWTGLELPPPAPVPLGFTQRVAARAREKSGAVSWATAPGRVRAAAAAALAAGIALGAGAGLWSGSGAPAAQAQVQAQEGSDLLYDDNLAESYWSALDEIGESGEPAADPDGDAP